MNNNEIIKKLQIKNGKLQVQIERLKLDKEEYYLDYLDLQQRIDKALDYIETHNKLERELGGTIKFNIVKIEDILRGKDIKEIPQLKGTLEQLDKLSIRGEEDEFKKSD